MNARFLLAATFLLAAPPASPGGEACCDPASPFRPGEGYPETLATCETLRHWADRAPQTDARITLGLKGRLTGVYSDGVMAYFLMCEPSEVQVMCVTYQTNGRVPGDTVILGGGYSRIDPHHVILDPCLASTE